ncbi:hypothetical protein PR048_004823 [Dryococelus australis]|uniref:Uncharacterized protein n=1 Tax=Dryococelus australis TaxID=614101 RepID=A0ABQ9I6H7_9NEOP|nr:hypothetical protein PR048_004823 [Dryococelus australis]
MADSSNNEDILITNHVPHTRAVVKASRRVAQRERALSISARSDPALQAHATSYYFRTISRRSGAHITPAMTSRTVVGTCCKLGEKPQIHSPAPAELKIEMKFISNCGNWRFEISIRDQQSSSTNIDESKIQNRGISLVQHFYIGTKIKLDPGSELGSFDLGSGKMLVQPGIVCVIDCEVTTGRRGCFCASEPAQFYVSECFVVESASCDLWRDHSERQSRKSDDNKIGDTDWNWSSESIVYIQNSITPLYCKSIKECDTLSDDCEASRAARDEHEVGERVCCGLHIPAHCRRSALAPSRHPHQNGAASLESISSHAATAGDRTCVTLRKLYGEKAPRAHQTQAHARTICQRGVRFIFSVSFSLFAFSVRFTANSIDIRTARIATMEAITHLRRSRAARDQSETEYTHIRHCHVTSPVYSGTVPEKYSSICSRWFNARGKCLRQRKSRGNSDPSVLESMFRAALSAHAQCHQSTAFKELHRHLAGRRIENRARMATSSRGRSALSTGPSAGNCNSFGFSHVEIVPDDAAGWLVFSGISRFPSLFIPALLQTQLNQPSSALKTSLLRAAQIS